MNIYIYCMLYKNVLLPLLFTGGWKQKQEDRDN